MVRLSDIPEKVLAEIEKFVKEQKGKVPVTSQGDIETLPDLVEKKFGYRLSPSQIYTLQKGEKTYRVKLDIETIKELEERFGSVGAGVKKLLKYYGKQKIPDRLREPYRVLLKEDKRKRKANEGDGLTPEEIKSLLKPFVQNEQEAWKIITELGRLGYVSRNKEGNYIIHEFRRDPVVELLMGFG